VVVLGHNKDDCLENIFQNISHQAKYDNLNGMSVIGEQDGIEFFRPLINIPKHEIIEYASNHGIPSLPNSTPVWSQRGQIRNTIVPVMDGWNSDFIPGLYHLASAVKDMHEIASHRVSEIAERFKGSNRALCSSDELPTSEIFWSMLLERILDRKFSAKSIRCILERLSRHKRNPEKKKDINFELSKDVSIKIDFTGSNPLAELSFTLCREPAM
jgi:tRNA(Ile)-lysidine synthase TilS/MesJ